MVHPLFFTRYLLRARSQAGTIRDETGGIQSGDDSNDGKLRCVFGWPAERPNGVRREQSKRHKILRQTPTRRDAEKPP